MTTQTAHTIFSVVIPARNEERVIARCIDSVRSAAHNADVSVEIIVVANRCSDRTEEIATSLGCQIVRDENKNLGMIRNAGARVATGDYLVTIDADSWMSRTMLLRVKQKMSSGRYIGGGVMMFPERWSLGIICTALYLIPIVIYYRISCGMFFCRREDFWAIGGFDETLHSVEDINFALRLKRFGRSKGKRYSTILSAYIVTSCRKFDYFGDWYFVLRPHLFLRLLTGRYKNLADKVWFDFEHR